VSKLHFQPNLDISACYDPTGERLDFPYEKVNHRQINPNESGGNVERWLIEVEVMMKKSLAYAIDMSMRDFLASDRIEWLQLWQGQVVICINQTNWCMEVEKTLTELESGGRSLNTYYLSLCDELMRTVELVRGDIPKALRISIGALVVMDGKLTYRVSLPVFN
jgi:dynein heavy chain